jgi:K+-transporting ATPase ATPase C chain
MKSMLKTCFLFFVIFVVLCGVVYPFLITGLAEVLFPFQANGSLLQKEGKVIGSKLVGQNYTSDKYFQGRLCTEEVSGGSNLGPTNQSWLNEVKKRVKNIKSKNKLPDHQIVPSDLVTDSASGLDPHISKAAAYLQIPRVAKARNVSSDRIKEMVDQEMKESSPSFFGEEMINVLQLNLKLDNFFK